MNRGWWLEVTRVLQSVLLAYIGGQSRRQAGDAVPVSAAVNNMSSALLVVHYFRILGVYRH